MYFSYMYIIFLKVTIYYRYIEIAYKERESDRKREGGGENKETAYIIFLQIIIIGTNAKMI